MLLIITARRWYTIDFDIVWYQTASPTQTNQTWYGVDGAAIGSPIVVPTVCMHYLGYIFVEFVTKFSGFPSTKRFNVRLNVKLKCMWRFFWFGYSRLCKRVQKKEAGPSVYLGCIRNWLYSFLFYRVNINGLMLFCSHKPCWITLNLLMAHFMCFDTI